MYAVIETGGKQHKVEEGQTLLIDLISDSKKRLLLIMYFCILMIRLSKLGNHIFQMLRLLQRLLTKLKELNYQFLDLEEESIVCANKGIGLNILK